MPVEGLLIINFSLHGDHFLVIKYAILEMTNYLHDWSGHLWLTCYVTYTDTELHRVLVSR